MIALKTQIFVFFSGRLRQAFTVYICFKTKFQEVNSNKTPYEHYLCPFCTSYQFYVAGIIRLHYDQSTVILQTSRQSCHFQDNQKLRNQEC